MSLLVKKYFTIFIVFIVGSMCTNTVTGNGDIDIDYNVIRDDNQLFGVRPDRARTTREILEMHSDWAIDRPTYTLQQATEHLLHFGALLRIQILDIFGALVYDHYDDFRIEQTEALYKVYQETLERKYNIFDILPSILAHPDMRPTTICKYIERHVRTCLKESSRMCRTIRQHDDPNPHYTSLASLIRMTHQLYNVAHIRAHFLYGFSLPAILNHLKSGKLELTVGLLSGLLHNVQYDSFDNEIRTAERNVLMILRSEMLDDDRDEVLMDKTHIQFKRTVGELIKELFERRKNFIHDEEIKKSFAILSKHVIREVAAISHNIEILGTVYENNKIDMNYLLNLILPQDVVDDDVTEAKDYLLQKINDYDIVGKYLKVGKYQQSGPDQLLMDILVQMRDIGFAVDLVTALHVHARFWHQSHMVNNLNELLELFDAYENLRYVPKYSNLMLTMDKIRNNLWNSSNVTVEILCNNPRACLRLGLETVAECVLINSETKNDIGKLFLSLQKSRIIETEIPKATENPITFLEEVATTELHKVQKIVPLTEEEDTSAVLSVDGDIVKMTTVEPTTTTKASTEWFTISAEDTTTTTLASESAKEVATKAKEEEAIVFTEDEQVVKEKAPNMTKLTTETQSTEKQLSEEPTTKKSTPIVDTKLEPPMEDKKTSETTSAEQNTTEQSGEIATTTTAPKITTRSREIIIDSITTSSDCYGDGCTGKIFSKSTNPSSSGTWDTDHSTPHLLSDNRHTTKLLKLSTTTSFPTTTEDSDTSINETEHIAPTLLETKTTASTRSKLGILLKKPKAYSVGSSKEDCSGKFCITSDCSGEECSSNSSPEDETSEPCNDFDCDFDASEENSQEDCSGNGCPSASEIFRENELQSSECIGDDCIEVPPTSNSVSDCIGVDCLDTSESDKSTCSGDECSDQDENRPLDIMQETDPPLPTTGALLVRCVNKDPHHHRKLAKLRKIRIMNALHHAARGHQAHSMDNVEVYMNGDDSSNDSHSRKPGRPPPMIKHPKLSHPGHSPWVNLPKDPKSQHSSWRQKSTIQTQSEEKFAALMKHLKLSRKDSKNLNVNTNTDYSTNDSRLRRPGRHPPVIKHPKISHQGLPPWVNLPKDPKSQQLSPWRQKSPNLNRVQKIENEGIRQQSADANSNKNRNISLINYKRYLMGSLGNDSTPGSPISQKVGPSSAGFQRVITRISSGHDLGKWEQKTQGISRGNLELDVPSDQTLDFSKRHVIRSVRTDPVVYQWQQSDDDPELVRKK